MTDFMIMGDPGSAVFIEMSSSALDSTLPLVSSSSSNLKIDVQFRYCELGESLSNSGQCEPCPVNFYILEAPRT